MGRVRKNFWDVWEDFIHSSTLSACLDTQHLKLLKFKLFKTTLDFDASYASMSERAADRVTVKWLVL